MNKVNKFFAVVVFNDDNAVSAVPSSWLSEDDKSCAWPVKYPSNFKKIIREPESRPDSDWIWLGAEVKRRYETFEEADNKTKKYLKVDAEASCSELAATPKSSRRKKPRREFQPTEITEPSGTIVTGLQPFDTTAQLVNVNQNPPFLPTLTTTTDGPQDDIGVINGQDNAHYPFVESHGTTNENIEVTLVDHRLTDGVNLLREEFRRFQELVLEKLESLRVENRETKQLLLSVLSSQGGPQTVAAASTIFQLIPIQTESEFQQLEDELKSNEDNYQRLVAHLKRGGGSSLSDNVYNILKGLFTDEMSKRIRLTSSTGKLSFRDSKLAQCVREAVHLSFRTDKSVSTDKQVNQFIGCWFRQRGYIRNVKPTPNSVSMDKNPTHQESSVDIPQQDKDGDNNDSILGNLCGSEFHSTTG